MEVKNHAFYVFRAFLKPSFSDEIKGGYMIFDIFGTPRKSIQKLAKMWPKIGPNLAQNGPKAGQKLARIWRRVGQELLRSWPEAGRKRINTRPEAAQKLAPNRPENEQNPLPTDSQKLAIPKSDKNPLTYGT